MWYVQRNGGPGVLGFLVNFFQIRWGLKASFHTGPWDRSYSAAQDDCLCEKSHVRRLGAPAHLLELGSARVIRGGS